MVQASASAESSETSQPNDAAAKAKAPVYDTYDPEKSLANRPVAGPKHEEAEPPGLLLYLLAGCAFVGTVLGFRRLFVRLTGTDPWLRVQELLPGLIEHTPVFRDFLETLNSGAPVPIEPTRQTVAPAATQEGTSGQAEFFHLAPKVIPGLRSKLAEVSRSADDAVRLRLLHQIRTDLTTCNVDSDAPVMLPAWQLVSALDGLLVQTLKRASNITHCVIRTIAGALDVLDALSAPATCERLSAARPARLLAVEDDPVSREAISIALKKTLPAADLAENGEAALALAAKNRYDVVFLDVELPGMNGFEVCTKLREIPLNRITPVVFVTQHADFDSRAKSFLAGGQDLISKPYLSFEIAVKAITLVIRARLAAGKQSALAAASKTDGVSPNPPAAPNPPANATSSEPAVPDATGASEVEAAVAAALTPFQDEFAAAFFAATQAHLPTLRSQLKDLAAAREDGVRHDVLSNLYLGIRALTADAEQAELRSLVRYCSVLQTFFRKLLEDTEAFAPHLVDMADAALDVLESL